MKNKLITFLIPSFEDQRILECIKSIKKSDIPEFEREILIQDGGSNINLLKKISNILGPRDRLLVERDSGIFDAINKGIDHSEGHYIATLGSDDRVFKIFFEDLKRFHKQGVDIIVGNLQYTDENWQPKRFWQGRKVSLKQYLIGRQFAHFGFICTKEVYKSVGSFNSQNKVNADYEFFYRLCLKISRFKQVHYDHTVVQMKLGGNSSRSLKAVLNANIIILKFILRTNPLLIFGFVFKPIHKAIEYLRKNAN